MRTNKNYGIDKKGIDNAIFKAKPTSLNKKAIDKKLLYFALAASIFMILSSVSALGSIVLSDQAANVKFQGNLISSGNLQVFIYDAVSGGNLVYNDSFNGAITDGAWSVTLGEQTDLTLEYGKEYYKDYKIDGTDIDFQNMSGATIERKLFYSPLGDISTEDVEDASLTGADISGSSDLTVATVNATGNIYGDFVGDVTGTADVATTWNGETSQADLNVNSSNNWDNLDTPSDINAGDITNDGTYRLQSWNNLTGIPHATPNNGDVTHFSLADEIFDWVVGLAYATSSYVDSLGNWSADKSSYYTSAEVDTEIGNANDSMKVYVDSQDVIYNDSMKVYVDAQDVVYNDSMKAYADARDLVDDLHKHSAENITSGTFDSGDFVFQGLVSSTEFVGTVNGSNIANMDITCVADTFMTAFNFSDESSTCTAISDVYLKNDGDTASGNYTFDGTTLHIDSTGNRVGIGTTAPTQVLDVNGPVRIRQSSGIGGDLLEFSDRYLTNSMSLGWNVYYDGNWKHRNTDYSGIFGFDYQGDFVFYTGINKTAESTPAWTEKMRITNDGNVGIGTTDPGTLLQLGSTPYVGGDVPYVSNSNDVLIVAGSGDDTSVDHDAQLWIVDNDVGTAGEGGGIAFQAEYDTDDDYVATLAKIKGVRSVDADAAGSSLAGELAFWTRTTAGALTERIRIDENGNVGIGTTDPARLLHLHSAGDNQLIQFTSDSTGSASSDGFSLGVASGNDTQIWNWENGYLRFGTNGTERMRIDSSGSVGIGTALPGAKLDVGGSASGEDVELFITNIANSGVDDGAVLRLIPSINDGVGGRIISDRGGRGAAQGSLYFSASEAAAENIRMTIDGSSGNVGIGTTTPDSTLEVVGTFTAEEVYLSPNDNLITGWTNQDYDTFTTSGPNVTSAIEATGDARGNSASFDLIVGVTYTLTSTLTLNSGEAPRLYWNGLTFFQTLSNGVNTYTFTATTQTFITIYNNVASNFACIFTLTGVPLTVNGNAIIDGSVGIGTATPSATLEINALSPTPPNILFSQDGDARWQINRSSATGALVFTPIDSPSRNFIINTGGNVGIGTTSPASQLHLSQGVSSSSVDSIALQLGPDDNSWNTGENYTLAFGAGPNSPEVAGYLTGTHDGSVYSLSMGSIGELKFATGANGHVDGSNSVDMIIDSSGNVGIGTTAPTTKLSIKGDKTISWPATSGTTQTGDMARLEGVDAAMIDFGSNGGSGLWMQAGRSDDLSSQFLLAINPNGGNVGIGTTDPSAPLDVRAANGAEHLRLSNPTSTDYMKFTEMDIIVHRGDGSGGYLNLVTELESGSWSAGAGFIAFKPNGTESMRLTTDGNVGIGTTAPDSTLEVTGDVHITNTTTGGNAGSDLCIDTNGRICACGSCA